MAPVRMNLAEYLDHAASTPPRWGAHDCCSFAADWVQTQIGADPMADLRGYGSHLAATRILKAEGGIVAAIERRLPRFGYSADAMPAPGDIGVVPVTFEGMRKVRLGLAAAIRVAGEHWAILGNRGVVVAYAWPVASWGL